MNQALNQSNTTQRSWPNHGTAAWKTNRDSAPGCPGREGGWPGGRGRGRGRGAGRWRRRRGGRWRGRRPASPARSLQPTKAKKQTNKRRGGGQARSKRGGIPVSIPAKSEWGEGGGAYGIRTRRPASLLSSGTDRPPPGSGRGPPPLRGLPRRGFPSTWTGGRLAVAGGPTRKEARGGGRARGAANSTAAAAGGRAELGREEGGRRVRWGVACFMRRKRRRVVDGGGGVVGWNSALDSPPPPTSGVELSRNHTSLLSSHQFPTQTWEAFLKAYLDSYHTNFFKKKLDKFWYYQLFLLGQDCIWFATNIKSAHEF